MSEYPLPETEVFEMSVADGQVCRIYVSKPATDPPEHGYPALTVLDGDTIIAGFAEARRLWTIANPVIGNSMIVAIGYQGIPGRRPRDRGHAIDHGRSSLRIQFPLNSAAFDLGLAASIGNICQCPAIPAVSFRGTLLRHGTAP